MYQKHCLNGCKKKTTADNEKTPDQAVASQFSGEEQADSPV
jgi:hypothetical protein